MSDNVTKTQETLITLTVEQLEGIIRKVMREALIEFASEGFLDLDKNSPLYEDMEDILEREKTNRLKFHTHAEVWNE